MSSVFSGAIPNTNLLSLSVGRGNSIARWTKGSVITFNGDLKSFPSCQDYWTARKALTEAATQWNALNFGVRVEPVDDNEPSVFQLVYCQETADNDGKTYATAFFPDSLPEQRRLFVFAKAFDLNTVEFMANIFLHEIGHILGLRHEFANELETENGCHSVQFGPRNALSVMNYFAHPRFIHIHQLDAEWVQMFYDFNRASYRGIPVIDFPARCLDNGRGSTL